MIVRFLAGPVFVVVAMLVVCPPLPAQRPGGGGGGASDPKSSFDRWAKGKDYIVISEMYFMKDSMSKFAKDNNITGDKLNFEQYKKFRETVMSGFSFGGFGKKGGGGTDGGGKRFGGGDGKRFGGPPAAAPAAPPKQDNPPAVTKTAEPPPTSVTTRVLMEDDLERRPVVYRAGKLPPGLPDWFEKLDLDKDGQVDLSEWRKAGKPIAEFKAMDLNQDALLTPEELLRFIALGGDPDAPAPLPANSAPSAAAPNERVEITSRPSSSNSGDSSWKMRKYRKD